MRLTKEQCANWRERATEYLQSDYERECRGGTWEGIMWLLDTINAIEAEVEEMKQAIRQLSHFVCGGNAVLNHKFPVKPETAGGCGQESHITQGYRCTDCGLLFHKGCIERHWNTVISQTDIDREERRSSY